MVIDSRQSEETVHTERYRDIAEAIPGLYPELRKYALGRLEDISKCPMGFHYGLKAVIESMDGGGKAEHFRQFYEYIEHKTFQSKNNFILTRIYLELRKMPQFSDYPDMIRDDGFRIEACRFGDLWDDDSPMPEDLVSPRILTPGGFFLLSGAPKVGKSDFTLEWICSMACGKEFLGMVPSRPLRVFMLQSEIQKDYLRERIRFLKFEPKELELIKKNLVITPQTRIVLDQNGVETVIRTIRDFFPNDAPSDIIGFDPLRNIFYAENGMNENDNTAMMEFLGGKLSQIQKRINPKSCLLVAHHIKKMPKAEFAEDPFNAISGAGALRGFYTAGAMLYREKEGVTTRKLAFELRLGSGINSKSVDKSGGKWIEVSDAGSESSVKVRGDAERDRKRDVILRILKEESEKGRLYTPTKFSEYFENKEGLGSKNGISAHINTISTQGYIKYNAVIVPRGTSKTGVMVTEGMIYRCNNEFVPVESTHRKTSTHCPIMEDHSPDEWHILD